MIRKRIGFNDIAILTRNRDNKYVSSLVSGLIRRGVPVSSSVEQNICDYPEVSLMINLLKLVDCASLNIPLAVVLKSPIGNFTEEDLAQMVLHYKDDKGYGEFYQAYRYALVSDNPLKERLVAFDEYLKDLRFRADFIGAKGVLEKACEDAYIIERLLASRQGKNKVKRLRRFISLTEYEGGSLTVSEMLNKIERNEKAFTLNESAENETVKVMTIHSSKGLEFPVVIVCGTEKEMSTKDNTQEILFDKDFGLAVKYYNDKDRIFSSTALREVIKKKNLVTFMKEEMRLFYVALTRAKYALLVTYEGEERLRDDIFSKASKFIHYLPNTILPRTLEPDELMEDQRETRKVIIGNTDENLIDKMKKDFSFVYDYQCDTTIPLKTNVTAINLAKEFNFNSNDKNATNVFVNLEEILDGQKPANTSKEIGTIAHKILENFDFNGEDLKSQTNALIESGILTCEEVSQVDLDRLFFALQSDAFKDISKKSIYREQSFLINIPANMIYDTSSNEQVLVLGIIDLLVVDNDSAQIIDYKYSRSDGEHLKERYKKQLDLYAFATEKILGKKVSKKTLVNIYSGEVLSID
jgi:ATP-dependent helicase/nuclease subunit A